MKLSWKPAWSKIIILVLVFRVGFALLGMQVLRTGEPSHHHSVEYYPAATLLHTDTFSQKMVNVWFRWDAAWYLRIAKWGYDAGSGTIAFPPLYPALIHLLGGILAGRYLLTALLLSTFFLIIGLILFYELCEENIEHIIALLAFPTAFFFFAAYTESLFFMLVSAVFLALKRKRWVLAGFLSGFAVLARFQGIIFSAVIFSAILVHQLGQASVSSWIEQLKAFFKKRAFLRQLLTPRVLLPLTAALIPIGVFAVYLLILKKASLESPTEALFMRWGIQGVMPIKGFYLFLQRLFLLKKTFIDWFDMGIFFLVLFFALWAAKRMPLPYAVYYWGSAAIMFTRGTSPHLLDSFSRYTLILFPFVFMFIKIPNKIRKISLLITSLYLQFFLLKHFFEWIWIA